VGPRTGMDDVEKRKFLILPGFELRPLGRPVRSLSLYRLRYPGSLKLPVPVGQEVGWVPDQEVDDNDRSNFGKYDLEEGECIKLAQDLMPIVLTQMNVSTLVCYACTV
jgi:hypothetical protein